MAAGLSRPSVDENISSTLAAGITDVATSFDVSDGSKIVEPCYLVIDRVDSAGTQKATTLWEYVKVTNVSTNTLTVTRGQGGSTAQSHSSGAVIEAVVTSSMFEEWYTALNPEHTSTGGHTIDTATVATLNCYSTATLSRAAIVTNLAVSGSASITGIPLSPVWVLSGVLSTASVGAGKPLIMPRAGTFEYFNVVNALGASGSSVIIDVNKNGTSIFDTLGRPTFPAAGTYVSTASIKTKDFIKGDIYTVDVDAGQAGMWVQDLVVQGKTT